MRKTYLRSGQAIRAQYVIPEGATLELTIRYCKPDFVREIFECEVIGEKKEVITSGTVGTQKFVFQNAGFYTVPQLKQDRFSNKKAPLGSGAYQAITLVINANKIRRRGWVPFEPDKALRQNSAHA